MPNERNYSFSYFYHCELQKLASFLGNTIQIVEDEIAPSSVKPLSSRASFELDIFEDEVIVIIFLPLFPLTITEMLLSSCISRKI